jgi:hypothetical protein
MRQPGKSVYSYFHPDFVERLECAAAAAVRIGYPLSADDSIQTVNDADVLFRRSTRYLFSDSFRR